MSKVPKSVYEQAPGFTLLELMISLALILVISSAAIGGMNYFQRNYRGNQQRKALQAKLRATVEQMSQEIGQAGLVPSGLSGNVQNPSAAPWVFNQSTVGTTVTLSSATAALASSLTVSSTASMYAGEWLLVDTPALNAPSGGPEELVQIKAITNATTIQLMANTVNGHSAGIPIIAQGVYPAGVWTNTAASTPLPDSNGHAQTLTIFGDINADGNMTIVKYLCPATSTTAGPLLRYQYNVSQSPTNTGCRGVEAGGTAVPDLKTTLIDNVTFCQFSYPPTTVTSSGNTYALSVGISLTVQSQNVDAQSDARNGAPITVTKNILNIQPRNIVNSYNLDTNPLTSNGLSEDSYAHQFQQLPISLSPQGILSSNCIP